MFFEDEQTKAEREKKILNQAKRNREVVYGAQASNRQMIFPLLGRETDDYDIFSDRPRHSALKLKNKLGAGHSVRKAQHSGTWRVIDPSGRSVADYSRMPERSLRTTRFGGVQYVNAQELIRQKKESLRKKSSSFRHHKDEADLTGLEASRFFF